MKNTAIVEYFCAREHITRVIFSATTYLDCPQTWECQSCYTTAYREPPVKNPSETGEKHHLKTPYQPVFSETHHQELRKRRNPVEAEALLKAALQQIHGETTTKN